MMSRQLLHRISTWQVMVTVVNVNHHVMVNR